MVFKVVILPTALEIHKFIKLWVKNQALHMLCQFGLIRRQQKRPGIKIAKPAEQDRLHILI